MAIDIIKGSHGTSFPTKIASMMKQYGHVYNVVLTADTDNGALGTRGDYVSFDRYEQGDVAANAVEGVIRELMADGRWMVEFTKVTGEVLYLYNALVSEYGEKELQDETLFYNKADEVCQGGTLIVGDLAAYNDAWFTGTPAVGETVKYASGKFVVQ